MSLHDVSVEQLAKVFYHYHEALAPDFNCGTEAKVDSWETVPSNERSRLIAAMRLALIDLSAAIQTGDQENKPFFAKPGEAEWGC